MHYQRPNSSVEIFAPNLLTLSCLHYVADKYEFRDLGSLVHAIVYFMDTQELLPRWRIVLGSVKHAKTIHLLNWWNTDLAEARNKDMIMLWNTHCLGLKTGNTKMEMFGIADFLRIAPNVITLILDIINTEAVNWKDGSERAFGKRCLEEELRGRLRHLKTVIVRSFVGSENELELLKYLLTHGVVLEKMSLLSAKPRCQFASEELLADTLKALQSFGQSFPNVEISLS
ncbi:hypothetical protein H6P81_007240 [Aristolochia fimbriata]|nr:hypothetical protein H6P81_007240 [Aristolochia fimbriata]